MDEQSFDWRLLVQSQTSKNHYIKMRTVREWILFKKIYLTEIRNLNRARSKAAYHKLI